MLRVPVTVPPKRSICASTSAVADVFCTITRTG
jgi:hypothetical protein